MVPALSKEGVHERSESILGLLRRKTLDRRDRLGAARFKGAAITYPSHMARCECTAA